MKVVSWEWFEQSLLRGMALEEAYFDPKLSVEERGKGAWERRAAPSPTFGKRLRGLDDGPPPNPLKRKLRRSASSRLGSQSQALWAGITAASVNRNVANNDDWNEEDSTNAQPLEAEAPQRDESIAQDNTHPSGEPPQPEAVARQDSWDDGIFQGRIVFTHKFDALKVRSHFSQHSRPR